MSWMRERNNGYPIQFRNRFLKGALIIGLCAGLNCLISPWVKIGFNLGHSVDGLIFIILKKEKPIKGELMAFWPPENRFYKNIWFVKNVKGIEGDVVKRVDRKFYLNNEFIGEAKERALNGWILRPGREGIIQKGQYFVWTPHKDSYDSRYKEIGWISSDRVIGRVVRLL